jgi:hypothetical protein
VADSCENGKELSASVGGAEYVHQVRERQLLKETPVPFS